MATWADTGKVHIWNVAEAFQSLNLGQQPWRKENQRPVYTVEVHERHEGFGLDWSSSGRLLSGDVSSRIFLTTRREAQFVSEHTPFVGHTASVEDIQWSPFEENVFSSASVDKTIKIWDARKKKSAALSIEAHNYDVNVISWNRKVSHLLASGSDDGVFSIWDLRMFAP